MPDEAVGLAAGFLIATMLIRVILLAMGIERWTTTWSVVNGLTFPVIWPLEQIGFGTDPEIVGLLTPLDVIVSTILVIVGLFLLATRTFTHRT